jgi:D-3-phosphoglycerate dehydrogenase
MILFSSEMYKREIKQQKTIPKRRKAMPFTVYIPRKINQSGIDYLLKKGYNIKHAEMPSEQEMLQGMSECDAVILRTLPVTRAMIENAKKLKIIVRHGVGIEKIDIAAATERGIWVATTKTANTNAVAEHTIGLMLACARHILPLSQSLKDGDFFKKDRYLGRELAGKTLGIVGLGNIGRAVAKKAAAGFDMRVIAYRHRVDTSSVSDEIRLVDWNELFATADIVSIHVPGRAENTKLIGKAEFERMKPDAMLVNVSRGLVVDEEALVWALQNRAIFGAGLDVFDSEPPKTDNPLLHMENVIAVPHIGSNTLEAQQRTSLEAAMEIDRVLTGNKPLNPVNLIHAK